jgi:hypothetical protein
LVVRVETAESEGRNEGKQGRKERKGRAGKEKRTNLAHDLFPALPRLNARQLPLVEALQADNLDGLALLPLPEVVLVFPLDDSPTLCDEALDQAGGAALLAVRVVRVGDGGAGRVGGGEVGEGRVDSGGRRGRGREEGEVGVVKTRGGEDEEGVEVAEVVIGGRRGELLLRRGRACASCWRRRRGGE